MASIKGFQMKNVKRTLGREGYGCTATMYLNGKKIGTYADYGDGGCEDVDYVSKEAEADMMKTIIAYAKENPNDFIINLYKERPQQYKAECERFKKYHPYIPDEDITIQTMASNEIIYIVEDFLNLLDLEKEFKKRQKKDIKLLVLIILTYILILLVGLMKRLKLMQMEKHYICHLKILLNRKGKDMLFVICIMFLVVGIMFMVMDYDIIGGILIYICMIAIFISIVVFSTMHAKSDLTDLQTEYLKLNYIKEYATENVIDMNITTSLLKDIQEYNDKVILRQNHHDNFWIGVYIPDRYDELKTIDYDVTVQIN